MKDSSLICRTDRRRQAVRYKNLNGLDYLEVDAHNKTLFVYFINQAPDPLYKPRVRLEGGQRIPASTIKIVSVGVCPMGDPERDRCMQVVLDRLGDFSPYRLCVESDEHNQFDPRYACLEFSFQAGCPSDLDCKTQKICPPPERVEPEINYLAKDYASFRQLILDRLSLIMPDWQERHVPDLGIALVELLAYVGDYLSYYQDAVATEAYLDTARQRISVRRHARLVDYQMHEGCNARTWVFVKLSETTKFPCRPQELFFITQPDNLPATGQPLTSDDLQGIPASQYEVFEPLVEDVEKPIEFYQAHNEIQIYTWGDQECCLPRGATQATLVDRSVHYETVKPPLDVKQQASRQVRGQQTAPEEKKVFYDRELGLKKGDYLLFEEVIGPGTGNPVDADPTHCHVVRLTSVEENADTLYDPPIPLLEVEWAEEDALPFALCLSVIIPEIKTEDTVQRCKYVAGISVARGNVVLVDHGRRIAQECLGSVPEEERPVYCIGEDWPSETTRLPGQFSPTLQWKPLTYCQPLPLAAPAARLLSQDPRQALPQIELVHTPAPVKPFQGADIVQPRQFAVRLRDASDEDPVSQYLKAQLDEQTRALLAEYNDKQDPSAELLQALLDSLNAQLANAGLFDEQRFAKVWLPPQTRALVDYKPVHSDLLRLRNRWLIEDAYAHEIAQSRRFFLRWTPRYDLLGSLGGEPHFVVETDNAGLAHLRFGDGELGRSPEAGMSFHATYRVGNGPAGNVGAKAISHIVFRDTVISGVTLQPGNPLPASGGTAPEPLAEVKLFAPHTFRKILQRAITADDYANLVLRGFNKKAAEAADLSQALVADKVQRAAGTLRWTGSWYEALVAIDQQGKTEADQELLEQIQKYLGRYRRMGHDLAVASAHYVPLDIKMTVCVLPNYLRGHVKAVLLDLFSNRRLPDGRLGFFHPDNLTFGEGIYLSKLVALARSVPGVENVVVDKLQRYGELPNHELENGILTLGPFEVARLDNDPSLPEHGKLVLDVRGGR